MADDLELPPPNISGAVQGRLMTVDEVIDAYGRAEAQLAALTRERNEAQAACHEWAEVLKREEAAGDRWRVRAEKAEAENRQLRDALRALSDRHDWDLNLGQCCCGAHLTARAIIAAARQP